MKREKERKEGNSAIGSTGELNKYISLRRHVEALSYTSKCQYIVVTTRMFAILHPTRIPFQQSQFLDNVSLFLRYR